MEYPRSVTGVFNESDTAYLEQLFFSKLVEYSGVYYKLWRHLNETRDPTTKHIMAKLDRFIEQTFGPGYVVVNDFFSYRDHNFKQFPDPHQDSIFWMVDTHDCAGFNLWVLLNHCQYNTSFEVFDVASNPELYEGIDFHSDPYKQRKLWKRRVRNARGSFVPLTIGGALVVRQPEVHRTDITEINEQQWRLALGFKVMRVGTIQAHFGRTALGRDETFDAITMDDWLPSWDVGAPVSLHSTSLWESSDSCITVARSL